MQNGFKKTGKEKHHSIFSFSKNILKGIFVSAQLMSSSIAGPLCVIYNLDAEGFDDFESEKVDAFKGPEIQYCNNRFISEPLSMIKLTHSGSDNWGVDWVKVSAGMSTHIWTLCP